MATAAARRRIGRRPVIASGLVLQALGFAWVAARASAGASNLEIVLALLVAGIGISMALPTVPTAVLNAVAPAEMGAAAPGAGAGAAGCHVRQCPRAGSIGEQVAEVARILVRLAAPDRHRLVQSLGQPRRTDEPMAV